MNEAVRIVEVGPRDGLQNEDQTLSVETRAIFIEKLIAAGLSTIEIGSFVSPHWVPQMAGTAELVSRFAKHGPVRFPVLVPNKRGLGAAISAGARDIAIFAAASETFSHKNINCSIDASLLRFAPLVFKARSVGLRVRGYVSCVLGCPYEGAVALDRVATVALRLFEYGCDEISLGDTIGIGRRQTVIQLVRVVAERVPKQHLAVHFHDTQGQAVANIEACLSEGIRIIDSAAGGLGGCPYACGAPGNVATEDVLSLLESLEVETNISRDRVLEAARYIYEALGKAPRSSG